ncbi:hypothetical protein AABM38_17970 [Heyndrickxia sp. MSNUG]|uniref:hypothetical protein n=1 Tax=Heyndrickxia sp. MSNUG TaxID=3136677 RepID=UPI003C2D7BD5
MIEIIFQKKQDAWSLYQHFIARLASWPETYPILLNEDRNRVQIPNQLYKDEMIHELKGVFMISSY